jgi:hypothetical protein
MQGKANNIKTHSFKHAVPGMEGGFTCSFMEFLPFCQQLYYFSNFKDFKTFAQA